MAIHFKVRQHVYKGNWILEREKRKTQTEI